MQHLIDRSGSTAVKIFCIYSAVGAWILNCSNKEQSRMINDNDVSIKRRRNTSSARKKKRWHTAVYNAKILMMRARVKEARGDLEMESTRMYSGKWKGWTADGRIKRKISLYNIKQITVYVMSKLRSDLCREPHVSAARSVTLLLPTSSDVLTPIAQWL